MAALRHLVVRNPKLQGWEYGMLRAFEEEIIKTTHAVVVDLPDIGMQPVLKRAGHGMRFNRLRKVLPRKKLALDADVIWVILMGPEEYLLDLFTGWKSAKHRIVYLFDTLEPQFTVIKNLFSSNDFTIKITSFNDAVEHLEVLTGKKWHAVEQACPADFFPPVPLEQRNIHFSSYGRRWPGFHETLFAFAKAHKLYYDFTTHDVKHPTAPPLDLYYQYAWHLQHSLFTVSWPVEFTNPARAGRLRPITCRWFEAAGAATIILGKKPANAAFDNLLFENMVAEIDPQADRKIIFSQLDAIWAKREALFSHALSMNKLHRERFTWQNRVQRILEMIQ